MFSVQWRKIEYNIGNSFDGTRFNAPKAGLYTFYATAQRHDRNSKIHFYVNGSERILTSDARTGDDCFSQSIQTTLRLNSGDTVEVRLTGTFFNTHNGELTFFEGRYIPRIN